MTAHFSEYESPMFSKKNIGPFVNEKISVNVYFRIALLLGSSSEPETSSKFFHDKL